MYDIVSGLALEADVKDHGLGALPHRVVQFPHRKFTEISGCYGNFRKFPSLFKKIFSFDKFEMR
jgi:hypothetical protein